MTTLDPSPPTIPVSRFGSAFSRWVTLVLGILLALMFTFVFVPRTPEQRLRDLEHPVRSAVRLFERDLEVHDALEATPSWMRRMGEIVFETSSETLSAAIRGYRDVLAVGLLRPDEGDASAFSGREPTDDPLPRIDDRAEHTPGEIATPRSDAELSDTQRQGDAQLIELRARLAILLEESGRSDDAREELARLDEAGRTSLAETVRVAYGERALEATRGIDSFDLGLLGPGWAKDRLLARLAERTNDTALASRLDLEAVQRGDHWRTRALFLMWLWKDRPPVLDAGALIPPAWGWDDGCAVLVRSAFAGMVISSAVALVSQGLEVNVFTLWIELVASLPMLWWIRRALLAPNGLGFRRAFGLWPTARRTSAEGVRLDSTTVEAPRAEAVFEPTLGRRLFSWTAFVLALIALDQLGAAVISVACRHFGAEPHWSEIVQESVMWSAQPEALLGALDGALWAPIFEEIGCRGLLYLTLRTRAGPQTAALFSASLFAMVHVYSLPGFLSVAWSGYLWAIAFERCKSLAPGMICHAFWNGFLIASNFVFYR
jgi:membrane protease YdiL (CAAX protease family)